MCSTIIGVNLFEGIHQRKVKYQQKIHNFFTVSRPQKGRAYVQNLLPYITRMARRTEEPLLETLASSLEKIMPVLGHFTNDNEIKNLLKAFLHNLSSTSSAIRRSAVTSLIVLCCHSRKPPMFFGWLLSTILQILVPVQDDIPTSQVLGCLLCMRSLMPHIWEQCSPSLPSEGQQSQHSTQLQSSDYAISYDQTLQVKNDKKYFMVLLHEDILALRQ